MKFRHCSRNREVMGRKTPLGHDLQAHIEICDECRKLWLVASAMELLRGDAASDPHPQASVTRIFVLARIAAAARAEKVYRRLVWAGFALGLALWAGLVWQGAGQLPQEGIFRGGAVVLAALSTALWASAPGHSEAGW